MVSAVLVAVCCPSCGRRLTEAEEIKGQRLRCKGCRALVVIDLADGLLTVQVNCGTA